MNKKALIITCCVATLAVIAVLVTFIFLPKTNGGKKTVSYENIFITTSKSFNISNPLIQSNIKNVFYSNDPLTYYEYVGGKLSEIKDTKKITVHTKVSGQDISAQVTYVKRGKGIAGSGIYNIDPSKSDKVIVYNYFYIKLFPLPEAYGGDSDNECLMVLDGDVGNMKDSERVYEESFILDLKTGDAAYRYLTDNNRTIDNMGAQRPDQAMLTDDLINSAGSKMLFFSSRKYAYDDPNKDTDLRSRAANSQYDDLCSHAHYMYARDTSNGVVFLRKHSGGFSSMLCDSKKSTSVIHEYSGDLKKDYLHDGNFIIKNGSAIQNPVLNDLNTGSETVLKNASIADASSMVISPDRTKLIIVGKPVNSASGTQELIFYNIKDGTMRQLAGYALYRNEGSNFCWVDNDTVAYNATDMNTKTCQLRFIRWNDIFKNIKNVK